MADPGRSARAACALAVTTLLLTGAVGCGKSGRPLPPAPRGPRAPERVVVRQLGERVIVHVTVPQARGDRPSQEPAIAELIRVAFPPGLDPAPDADAFRRRGVVVGIHQDDPLESGSRIAIEDRDLAGLADAGVGWLVRYGVRVRDRRGRTSPLVVGADLRPLPPVAAPTGVVAEPTADGIRLAWTAVEPGVGFRVYRRSPGERWPELPLHAPTPLEAVEYLDTAAATGATYEYTVRTALAAGAPLRESESAPPVTLVAVDRFAPAPPAGLTAVQEGGAVRLFWSPSPERDLAGYRVERRVDGGPWAAVGPDPVEQPTYLDADVRRGQVVEYRVRSVDRADPPNVGDPSEVVRRELVDDDGFAPP